MIIELSGGADPQQVLDIVRPLAPYARAIFFRDRRWIVCGRIDLRPDTVTGVPGVAKVMAVRAPYPLASVEFQGSRSRVRVGPCTIGNGNPVIIAGPCSVENRQQLLATARHLADVGCHLLRGGAFKPRTSPYSFQGLGRIGLELLAEARASTGLPIVTEVLTPEDVDLVARCADMLQIGARNMQNFPLLRSVGQTGKPVLLKRAPWADLHTWLHAAEYILAEGNFQVVLCERGICASEASSGRHLDLAAVLRLRHLTHLPVIVDPSHGTGDRRLVVPMALAALVVGADGLMIEVHPEPDRALSDGPQSITFEDFDLLTRRIHDLHLSALQACGA